MSNQSKIQNPKSKIEPCALCTQPANPAHTLGGFPICDTCAAVLDGPDDVCFHCESPLSEEELAAGATLCADCADREVDIGEMIED